MSGEAQVGVLERRPPSQGDGLGAAGGGDPAARLVSYVPRVALSWLAESPERTHLRFEGTALFVDVSGFTALTERLAARGKVGAEEISDVIDGVFNELLGVADAFGADLWKWGGDAALLFFPDPGSAARACRAAVLMSRTMGRIGRLRTSAGRVNLAVSVGAHSGGFDLYLLGDRHRELVVTGPAATVTARMEATAEAGEVVVSPDTARRLEAEVLGDSKDGGILLKEAPAAEGIGHRPMPAVAGLEVASLLAAPTKARLLGGGEEDEHRQASVAFLEFSGTDALSFRSGAEAVATHLDVVVRATEEAAERYGVSFHSTDIGPDGGKIVLLGGVPVVRGNDAERLLRAVHDVLSAHAASSPLRLRAGVNAGRVFVFDNVIGLADRRVFSIAGDAVNLAARVMGKAAPGQLLATEAVLGLTRNPFETQRVPPFNVKGKSEPVVAFAVGAACQADSGDSDGGLPFVGRDGELEQLLCEAAAAERGSGGVVEIVGPPGIGKSRLVSEALARWPLRTIRVACELYGSATPYLAFRTVFRRLLGFGADAGPEAVAAGLRRAVLELTPELEPFLPLLAGVVDVPTASTREVEELEGRFRRTRLEDCAVALLRGLVSRPSALVLEDAHALDEASASLLGKVVLEAGELPLLVVLTCGREGGPALLEGPGRRLVLDLKPLGGSHAGQLAGAGGSVLLSPAQVAAIVDRAEGNPLFLRELLRAARELGSVEGLPDSVEPLLAAEIDLLAPSDQQVLRAAAVLGASFEPGLLGDLLEEGMVLDEKVWARLGAFVAPTASGWRFAHNLMRDAAYEGLSFKRRKELHARAGRAIEARAAVPDEAAELLSLHWLRAECYAEAWRYSRLAGERARSLWANTDAATFYGRALEAASHLRTLPRSELAAVAEALGDACELAADYDRSRHAYAQARRLGGDEVDRARLLRKVGVLYEREGRYREALACYTRGHRLLGEKSRAAAGTERAELTLASAGIRSRQGHYRDCTRFAALAATEASRASHRSGLAHALYLQHMMSVYLGRPEDDLGQRALSIFEELGDLVGQGNALNNLGIGAYYRGDWAEAGAFYERSREARVRSGDVVGAATAENNIAEILSDQGELGAARTLFESARATWLAAGYRVGAALATSNLGRLEARAGEVERGRRWLEEALAAFREIRSPVFSLETEARLAECHVLEGNFAAAGTASRELLQGVQGRPGLEQLEVMLLRLLGTARALGGAAGGGSRLGAPGHELDEAVERAAALGAPYELALSSATRACLAAAAGGPEGREVPGAGLDRERAEAILDRLGVSDAVITWSTRVSGRPIFARGASAR